MTALLPDLDWATADDAMVVAAGPGLYAEGWGARLIPTGPTPEHAEYCALADYGFPAEVCACTAGTTWLRQRHGEHLRHHPH